MNTEIDNLSDETRLACGWMTNFAWADLKADKVLCLVIVQILNKWTKTLIENGFNVQAACPIVTDHKYTFGQLSASGREDWAQYTRVLERICKRKGCHA